MASIFGLRIPFTGKTRRRSGKRRSRRSRYARRAALAGGAGATYIVMRGRRTNLLRR